MSLPGVSPLIAMSRWLRGIMALSKASLRMADRTDSHRGNQVRSREEPETLRIVEHEYKMSTGMCSWDGCGDPTAYSSPYCRDHLREL